MEDRATMRGGETTAARTEGLTLNRLDALVSRLAEAEQE
jgi:hypothetical protein